VGFGAEVAGFTSADATEDFAGAGWPVAAGVPWLCECKADGAMRRAANDSQYDSANLFVFMNPRGSRVLSESQKPSSASLVQSLDAELRRHNLPNVKDDFTCDWSQKVNGNAGFDRMK
jgi:hypothetical protein